jgi:hypothetical protein
MEHHAAHGTILINFVSEKRSYVFLFTELPGGFAPCAPTGPWTRWGPNPQTPRQQVRP